MDIKTYIKNQANVVNHIVPFVKKYRYDGSSTASIVKNVFNDYKSITPVNRNANKVVDSMHVLFEDISISDDPNSQFLYFIDDSKTIRVDGNVISNISIDYSKIVNYGFRDICEKAYGTDDFGKDAKELYSSVEFLVQRILKYIPNVENVDKREKLSKTFSKILYEKSHTFEDALQRILFFNQILWQTRHRLNGLGRLDLILNELYQSDLDKGVINNSKAENLLFDFLNQLSRFSKYKSDALLGDIGQIVIVGGLISENEYFCNDLTHLFLKIQGMVSKPDPKILIRVSRHMDDSLLKGIVECLACSTGSPLISNDDVVIPSLISSGIDVEDAYNYATSACWEPYIVGKSFDQNNIKVFDFMGVFDSVMQDSEELAYDKIVDLYIQKNKKSFEAFVEELDANIWCNDALISVLDDSCIESRTDIADGGSKYSNYGITTVALPNIVDSLLFIKEFVFEKKKYTLSELNKARKSNFDGAGQIYQDIISKSYFGHDNDEAIKLSNKITSSLVDVTLTFKNKFNGFVKLGLSSPGYNMLNKNSPADFSGRKHSDAYRTHISCNNAAYTELVNFSSKLNYSDNRYNGNVVDIFLNPSIIKNNFDKFTVFLKASIVVGFFQMQMNVVSSKELIEAKKHPELHKDLIVRVWGFSSYFNDLSESYKDIMIQRAMETEKSNGW